MVEALAEETSVATAKATAKVMVKVMVEASAEGTAKATAKETAKAMAKAAAEATAKDMTRATAERLYLMKVLCFHHRFVNDFLGGRLLLSHKHSTSCVTPCYTSYICGYKYVIVSSITVPKT